MWSVGWVAGGGGGGGGRNVQAYDAESDDKVGVEDVGDSEGEAQDYAQYAGPNEVSRCSSMQSMSCVRRQVVSLDGRVLRMLRGASLRTTSAFPAPAQRCVYGALK